MPRLELWQIWFLKTTEPLDIMVIVSWDSYHHSLIEDGPQAIMAYSRATKLWYRVFKARRSRMRL